MHVWNVLHVALWKYRTQKIAIFAPSHNFVGLYLGNWGMHRQSEKTCLSNNASSTCPDNMVNFGLLTAEISWRVWGTAAHFNTFHILAALLHGTLVVGVSQTLRRWTEGTTLYLAGRPSCWALAHISSWCWLTQIDLEKWPLNGCLSGSCGEVIISTITWCPFSVELHWNECFYCFWQ